MKRLLAKPGRNGGWSSFLRSERIAKATADRLVRQRQESGGEQSNIVTEEVPQSGAPSVERLLTSLLPRLRGSLTTAESAYDFVVGLVGAFGLACDPKDDGMLIFNPSPKGLSAPVVEPAAVDQAAAVANASVGAAA